MEKTLEKYSIKFIEVFEYLLESMENEIKIRLENKKGNDKKVSFVLELNFRKGENLVLSFRNNLKHKIYLLNNTGFIFA